MALHPWEQDVRVRYRTDPDGGADRVMYAKAQHSMLGDEQVAASLWLGARRR